MYVEDVEINNSFMVFMVVADSLDLGNSITSQHIFVLVPAALIFVLCRY